MKKSSFKNQIWLYLSVFSIVILFGILLLQVISSNLYYELVKMSEIKDIASEVEMLYLKEEYNDLLNKLSFEKDICIEITEKSDIVYSTDSVSRGCLVYSNQDMNDKKRDFMLSDEYTVTYKANNPIYDNKTLIYGIKIDNDTYGFISTSLEAVTYTSRLLERQLLIITIIIFVLAFIVSYILSKKFSKPLENINKLSKKLSKGDYTVDFKSKSDIKEISELESTLNNLTKELSKAENLRRELLANVSHDLKTPLTIIKANAEMVKDITYKNKEKRDNNLDTITEEVDRLNLLVEDILDLSRMQSNSINLELSEFNLNRLIKSIIKRFKVLCDNDGYSIDYNGFDFDVKADKKKIEQVIYNLINNAINYTGDNKKIYVNLIENKDFIRIEVIDTGSGIKKEDLSYIWDKYYKVDKKYKRVTYGTGLGLSIVKNILILHNFNYGVETSKKGTKFYFDIKK